MKEFRNLQIMQEFGEEDLPNLDVAVLGALELFESVELPKLELPKMNCPLVLGSGNAEVTGRILFKGQTAVFADESNFKERRTAVLGIEEAVLISASGSRDAVKIAKEMKKEGKKTFLITNNSAPAAGEFIDNDKILVFPRNREPYTYNISTYMGMILAKTKEDPRMIRDYLKSLGNFSAKGGPASGWDFSRYNAFYFLVADEFEELSPMFRRKFDELFGSKIAKRVFTLGQTAHGHTVVENEKELFIGLGVRNEYFGLEKNRLDIELPNFADFACVMALGYYLIGKIQGQHPSYFKESIKNYTKRIAQVFGKEPKIIVE